MNGPEAIMDLRKLTKKARSFFSDIDRGPLKVWRVVPRYYEAMKGWKHVDETVVEMGLDELCDGLETEMINVGIIADNMMLLWCPELFDEFNAKEEVEVDIAIYMDPELN